MSARDPRMETVDVVRETQFGFQWGPLEVVRSCNDETGWCVEIRQADNPTNAVAVMASPQGRRFRFLRFEKPNRYVLVREAPAIPATGEEK